MVRFGIGFDVHPLVVGRKLILGGIQIKYGKGLAGHSDADVACHAIADALLGAAGLGDIGMMFPDSDPQNKDISSLKILEQIIHRLAENQFAVVNVDVTVVAQQPRIAPFVQAMRDRIASALNISAENINIKGKSTEQLGFIGRQEGIAALAVASITKNEL
jgi:2-C-methyl-D-erythritol 2,4-cyclodiphosphate synthase